MYVHIAAIPSAMTCKTEKKELFHTYEERANILVYLPETTQAENTRAFPFTVWLIMKLSLFKEIL